MSSSARSCPWCAAVPGSLFIAEILEAKPIGTWSLAGVQNKAVVRQRVVLVCRSCRRERTGSMASHHCEFDVNGETEQLSDDQLAHRLGNLIREA